VTEDLVCRTRLHERLDLGLETPVTLVAAPAGYGKSMLVSHWAESRERPCAWVSLDEADSDVGLFLRYIVAAVQSVAPGSCEEVAGLLHAANLPSGPVLARTLANELDELDTPVVLALDDYHRIARESGVHPLLSVLLDHPPPPLRLVIATRRDPPLPLGALRAAGRLTEVRLQDLRFTDRETAELLAAAATVSVGEEALGHLQHEVEGWAVGLRLLVLALRHVENPESFLMELRGGFPQIQEYLLREVLGAQPPEVREGMLRASILERFCSELLDAVCAPGEDSAPRGPSGAELLQELQQGHLFTVPLDARGEWFRYHHLFRELLQGRLRGSATAERIAALHLRASEWFESRGLVGESIDHALAAGDLPRAAELVERHRHAELDADRWYVVDTWLARLPEAIKSQRPGLLLAQAWSSFFTLRLDRMASFLDRVEPLLAETTGEPGLLGEVHYFRGYLSYWGGEGEASRRHFEEALQRLPAGQQLIPGEAALHLGLARSMTGQKGQAVRELRDRIRDADPARSVFLSRLIGGLALIDLLSGDLPRARAEARRLLEVARESRLRNTEGWAWYMSACTHLHALDLVEAADHFARATELRYVLETVAAVDSLAGLALTQQLLGRSDEAEETVGRLEEFAGERDDPGALSVARSCRARLALLRGERDAAAQWARSFDETPESATLFVWVEVPGLTQVRTLVALGTEESLGPALERIEDHRALAESCGYTCQTIEAVVLQSLALEKQGRGEEAGRVLAEALALAGPGGWIRPFVEAGPMMAGMVERLRGMADPPALIDRVLAAFGDEGPVSAGEPSAPVGPADEVPRAIRTSPVGERRPLEDLTNRELDILELLAQRLQNKEIADRLSISPQTVNYHLKHVYQKLEVGGRRRAVDRAMERGLLRG
jgi:LuxR family maltose regulon positive regulatory protein